MNYLVRAALWVRDGLDRFDNWYAYRNAEFRRHLHWTFDWTENDCSFRLVIALLKYDYCWTIWRLTDFTILAEGQSVFRDTVENAAFAHPLLSRQSIEARCAWYRWHENLLAFAKVHQQQSENSWLRIIRERLARFKQRNRRDSAETRQDEK